MQFSGSIIGGLLAVGLLPPHTTASIDGTGYAAPYACMLYRDTGADPGCWQEAFGAEIVGTYFFLVVYALCYVAGHGSLSYLSTSM